MKRIPPWISLIVLTSLLTIGIPSCGSSDYAAIRDIRQVIIYDPVVNQSLASPASTSSDSLVFIIWNEIDFFSLNQIHFSGTMSEAWAFEPASPWLANEISDIRVYSDQPMYGHPSHTNLSDQLKFGSSINFQLSLDQFLKTLPHLGEDFDDSSIEEFQIFLNTKPQMGIYTFTIEIEDNNGHIFSANTIPINWI
ncbi:MAG: hypothetical protein WBP41_09085 [Saprospiraceae bacterium]